MQYITAATSLLHMFQALHHECEIEGHAAHQLWDDLSMIWNPSTADVWAADAVRFYRKYIKDFDIDKCWAMTFTFLGAAESGHALLHGSNLGEQVKILEEQAAMLLGRETVCNAMTRTQRGALDPQVQRTLLECRIKILHKIRPKLVEFLSNIEGLDLDYISESSSSGSSGSPAHTNEIQNECFICVQSYNFPGLLLAELDDCIKLGDDAIKSWIDQAFSIAGDPEKNVRPVRTKCGHIMCETCLTKWICLGRTSPTCPFCRTALPENPASDSHNVRDSLPHARGLTPASDSEAASDFSNDEERPSMGDTNASANSDVPQAPETSASSDLTNLGAPGPIRDHPLQDRSGRSIQPNPAHEARRFHSAMGSGRSESDQIEGGQRALAEEEARSGPHNTRVARRAAARAEQQPVNRSRADASTEREAGPVMEPRADGEPSREVLASVRIAEERLEDLNSVQVEETRTTQLPTQNTRGMNASDVPRHEWIRVQHEVSRVASRLTENTTAITQLYQRTARLTDELTDSRNLLQECRVEIQRLEIEISNILLIQYHALQPAEHDNRALLPVFTQEAQMRLQYLMGTTHERLSERERLEAELAVMRSRLSEAVRDNNRLESEDMESRNRMIEVNQQSSRIIEELTRATWRLFLALGNALDQISQ